MAGERSWPGPSLTATLLRDTDRTLSLVQQLEEREIVVLLTPIAPFVAEDPNDRRDPFENLGRALERRHCRIRQIPYLNSSGITGTHLVFFERASVVIFVVNSGTSRGPHVPADFAHLAKLLINGKPFVLVVTCNVLDLEGLEEHFPTVIQSQGYTRPALESVAGLIFGEHGNPPVINTRPPVQIQPFLEARDLPFLQDLWQSTLPPRYRVDENAIASILDRVGYAKHHVARNDVSRVIGFCATYLSYMDTSGDSLLGSIALLVVHPDYRRQGIGFSLLKHAIRQLRRTRGVARFQLGSTFPRLLSGPPVDMQESERWFVRRGWPVFSVASMHCDLTLDLRTLETIPTPELPTIYFRQATTHDMGQVLNVAGECCERENHLSWFDQYQRLVNNIHLRDVMVAHDQQQIIAVALTYTPMCGSSISNDMIWPRQLGVDVGGVTCICLSPGTQRELLMEGMLYACALKLRSEGMNTMFADAVTSYRETYNQLGFQEWARYFTVTKEI